MEPERSAALLGPRLGHVFADDRLLAERLADAPSPSAASVMESLVAVMEAARASGSLRFPSPFS